jgi:hypothetical protein
MGALEIDWAASSTDLKRRLYEVIRRLEESGRLSRPEFYAKAFGPKPALGVGFQNNFSTGRISARNAALIHDFLRREFPEEAREITLAYHDTTLEGAAWLAFLHEHGIEDPHSSGNYLSFIRIPTPQDLAEPVPAPPFGDGNHHLIAAHSCYLVQYYSGIDGHAVGLHAFGNDWFISSRPQPVHIGRQWLRAEPPGHVWPIQFDRPGVSLLYAVIAGPFELIMDVVGSHDIRYPLPERHLNSVPGLLRTSKAKWEIVYADLFCF